ADDYRRERERILAVATGGASGGHPQTGPQPVAPQPGPPGGQQPGPQPGQSGPVNRGQDAFPPPFKWTTERPNQTPAPQGGAEERTQAVTAAQNAEKTQIVDMNDTASKGPGPSFGDRTQLVPQVPPNSPPQGMPAQPWGQQQGPQQGAWGPGPQQQQQSSPPWENQEELVPPWAGYQGQGSELFEADEPRSRGKMWAIIGVVVLLLAVGGVLYLTVLKPDDSSAQQGNQQPQEQTTKKPAPSPEKPPPFGPLYVPEGTTSGGKTYSAAELEKSKALPTPDLVLLKQAGLKEARSVIVVNESTTISMWSFSTNDPPTLAQDITTDQGRFGFKEAPDLAQQGVAVYSSTQKSASRTVYVFRAHYTNGDNVIRVEAFDPDQDKARSQFDAALKAQLELTAPE
ncbi:MAG TPA: hypothetical protein VNP20_15560, partial [Nocardioidaceae bacterium]|nr:hypothetical protein [Nocardioidaceae bacterium]